MSRLTKKQKEVNKLLDSTQSYSVEEAIPLLKKITKNNFDATVDIAVRLGVDPKKSDQMLRGVVLLPNGTGKKVKILALVTPDKEQEAKDAGADYVGLNEYLEKIKNGWTEIDTIVTMPSLMGKLGPLGKVLGPRGLMPNPKTGTITMNIGNVVKEIKAGKIEFRVDKTGIIHAGVGKISFKDETLTENINEVLSTIISIKPSTVKGIYMKSVYVSSTMSPSIALNV